MCALKRTQVTSFVLFVSFLHLILLILATLLLKGGLSVSVLIVALVLPSRRAPFNISKRSFEPHPVSLQAEQCAPTLGYGYVLAKNTASNIYYFIVL